MLIHPAIDPVLLSIGPLKIHWYGVMYLLAFVSAWALARYRIQKQALLWTDDQLSDLVFYGAMGVVLGGRIGYMIFYQGSALLAKPWTLFMVWQGGMSFHGGLLGVLLALFLFARKESKHYFEVADFVAPLVPIGLAMGRLGNFINGELWGRVTTVPWGMIFLNVDNQPRHPSQLYELCLEGLLLFIILWFFTNKPRPRYVASGMFLFLYGIFRFTAEHFRQPDAPLGFIAFDWLTMGQLLSLPMVVFGVGLLIVGYTPNSKEDMSF